MAEMVAEMGQQGDGNGRDGGGCRRAVVVGVERWWRPGAEQVTGVETRGGDVVERGGDGERLGEELREQQMGGSSNGLERESSEVNRSRDFRDRAAR
ncbi:hypothetical protein AMTRI_Chr02g217570 [Amborella trichopoda]|uniref:Uncharacterized protein n=1 Tax=Amborella trichopoda TaxID=13333 RepID=W1NNS3_AMBTC|nr:hypothetical protein AMTR_s00125p00021330 [Amborella trichopoda]